MTRFSISSFTHIGTASIIDEESRKRIILVNSFSLAITFLLLLITPIVCYFLHWRLSIIIPMGLELLINACVPILNYYRKSLTASIVLYFLQCVAITYFGILLGKVLPLQFMTFTMILMLYLIFKGRVIRTIALTATIGVFITLQISYYYDSLHPAPISLEAASIIESVVLSGVILLLVMACKTYIQSNDASIELKQANQYIKIFLAQVTHELRSPLNALHQIIQLLSRNIKKEDTGVESQTLLNMSLVASCNMRNIVNNVLDMSEIESGKIEIPSMDPFLVKPFFRELIELNSLIAQAENIDLEFTIQGMPAVIKSNPVMLSQITTNLLVNAIKYGLQGKTVRLSVYRDGQHWVLQVINKGRGIPASKIATIFDPFITSRNGYTEGTGLGLYIVKNKVAALGGTIHVESELNGLTTFTVRMPLQEGRMDATAIVKDETELLDLRSVHVMIAEDNRLSAITLSMTLQELGCTVTAVDNGLELLKAMETSIPDIIIIDYHMPQMDGMQTILRIRKEPHLKHIPIIVSTGDLHIGSLDSLLAAGADCYVEKPIDVEDLHKIISHYLTSKPVAY